MPVVRPSLKYSLLLAFLAALAGAYFVNTPIPMFQTRLKEAALALAILWSAGGWGTRLIQFIGTSALTLTEESLFAETIGLGVLSWLMILFGAMNAWIPTGGWALVATGILASGPFLRNLQALYNRAAVPWALPSDAVWPVLGLNVGVLISFILALAPVTYYDSLVYHFAMPAAYLRAHHWLALPGLIYSSFPQSLEMLWTLALLIGDDTVANLIAWSLGVLLLSSIIAYARRFFDLSVGLIAAALMALMPAFLLLSSGGYVDVGLTLFSFMALYAACLWRAQPNASLLIYAGAFAGWAVGIKYTGALISVLTLIALLMKDKSSRHRVSLKEVLIYSVSVLVIFGPWLIKNLYYVGNPVFPFFYSIGFKNVNPWVHQAAAGYFAGITEYTPHALWELPQVLWNAAVNGISFGRGIDVLGDFGWLPLLGFVPALWLARQRPGAVKLLLILCAAYIIPWEMSRPVLRFLLPVSPLLALLAAWGWVHGVRTQPTAVRWVSRGFLVLFLISGLHLFFFATSVFSAWMAALGFEPREAYLRRVLNYYPAAVFINTQTPPDSRVYVFGDQRGYYYERQTGISPVFSKNPLMEWANAAADARALKQTLLDAGYTHVLVNRVEFQRLKSYPYSVFTEKGLRNWTRLQSSLLKAVYRDPACDVFVL